MNEKQIEILVEEVSIQGKEVAVLKDKVIDLLKELKGNGQKGFIAIVFERIEKLENWKWFVMGITTAITTALTLGLHYLLK